MATLKSRPTRARSVYQSIPVQDLTGGLDLRRSPTLLEPTRSVVCRNFSLAEPGALRVRYGWADFTTSALTGSSHVFQGGQRVYLGSTQGTIVALDGNIYLVNDNGTFNGTAVSTSYSTVNQIYFPYDREIVAALDGATLPRKSTNLTTWSRLGIAPSAVKCTSVSEANSSETLSTSEFSFVFTYKDRGLSYESDPTTAASTVRLTSTGNGIRLTIPNSTDPQVDAIVVYAKNVTAGETVYRKVSSLAQSAGVSSTLIVQSSAWSANDEAPSTHGVPPFLSFGVVWKNRWWARSAEFPTRLYFTEIFEPQAWPALYFIDLPFDKGEEIQAIQPQGDTLLVMGQSQVFLVIGQTSLDFEVRPSLGSQGGALGPRATALIEAGVVHASAEGVFIFDGATDRLLSHDLTPGWRDMIDNSTPTAASNVAMVYDWKQKELRIAVPRLYPRATRGEWVLDLNRTRENNTPAWSDTDRNIVNYIFWSGDEPVQGNRGKLQSYSSTNSKIVTEATGTTANGANMVAEYGGPTFSAGLHRARYVDMHTEYEPHAGSATVEAVIDGVSQGQISMSIGSGIATYGSGVYGTAVYGGSGRRKHYTPLPLGSDGRSLRVNYSYTGQERFAIYTYSAGIVPESEARQFAE
jgi:hypothetical protein